MKERAGCEASPLEDSDRVAREASRERAGRAPVPVVNSDVAGGSKGCCEHGRREGRQVGGGSMARAIPGSSGEVGEVTAGRMGRLGAIENRRDGSIGASEPVTSQDGCKDQCQTRGLAEAPNSHSLGVAARETQGQMVDG